VQRARRRENRHPLLRRGAIVVAAGLALLLALGAVAYVKLNGNITKYDVSKLLGQRPKNNAKADKLTNLKPVNILVIGSDTRDLGTRAFGTTGGARSDTTLIVHLSGDRRSAVVVSVPRDSMTRAPSDCKNPKSKVADGPIRMWNANYSLGGPACLIRTVEGTTGIFIDHFMVVNFLGFQSMVDALGSVEVCMPEAVHDPLSQLNLPKGRSRVSGKEALAFVRVRHNIGNDASDLGRIDRQQAFLSSMVQEATSSGLLLRPDKLFRFLDAATKSLTTDPGLGNLNALREVAQSVVGLKSSQIRFVTVPVEAYPPDHNRVQWTSDRGCLVEGNSGGRAVARQQAGAGLQTHNCPDANTHHHSAADDHAGPHHGARQQRLRCARSRSTGFRRPAPARVPRQRRVERKRRPAGRHRFILGGQS